MTSTPLDCFQEDTSSGHSRLQTGKSIDLPNEGPVDTLFTTDLAADIDDWIWMGSQLRGSSPAPFSFDNLTMNSPLQPLHSPGPFSLNGSTTTLLETPRFYPPVEGHEPPAAEGVEEANCIETVPQGVPVPTGVDGSSSLPVHAAELLRYLRTEVLERRSPSSNLRLSPWKKLILPCALETFAELSLWNTTSHTRLGILCALLAKGAYHLHRAVINDPQQSLRWRGVAANHRQEAQRHLKLALRAEVEGKERAEYTELLMAMLVVCFVSVSGSP